MTGRIRTKTPAQRVAYNAYMKAWREEKLKDPEWRKKDQERRAAYDDRNLHRKASYNIRRRMAAVLSYGGACTCCGESRYEFLTFDHIDGRQSGKPRVGGELGGAALTRWLHNNNYPGGIQIMCYNCNNAKHKLGGCRCQTELTGVA